MPPLKKYSKDSIISICLDLVKNEGFDKINARRIASILGSSVQPIFHNFKNMEELKKAVYDCMYDKYKEYMLKGINEEKAYKKMGLGYILFARDYPEYFKSIFMQKTNLDAESFIIADDAGNSVIEMGQKLTNLNYEEQKKFHVKVWIFTHGIACLVATKTIKISEQEIAELLEKTVKEMLIGFKKGE